MYLEFESKRKSCRLSLRRLYVAQVSFWPPRAKPLANRVSGRAG